MRNVRPLICDEQVSEASEASNVVLGYELQFLAHNASQTIHKVEVRSINFNDVLRHLRQGDSVLIAPKLQESLHSSKKQDEALWYFTHI